MANYFAKEPLLGRRLKLYIFMIIQSNMVDEIYTMVAISGNKIKGNPYVHQHKITTEDIANTFNIPDFGINNITLYDGETNLPDKHKVSKHGDIERYFYKSGSAFIEGDNNEKYTIVTYPQYDVNLQQNHYDGKPHFNYYSKIFRIKDDVIIGDEKIQLPLEIHSIPYKKIRTQYWRSGSCFADHERDSPE